MTESACSNRSWLPVPGRGSFIAMIICEGLLLCFALDSVSIYRLPLGWSSALLAIAPHLIHAIAVLGIIAILLGWPRMNGADAGNIAPLQSRSRYPLLFGHAATFVCLIGLTFLLGRMRIGAGQIAFWVGLWFTLAALVVACWVLAFIPARRLIPTARLAGPLLVASLICAMVAWFIARFTQEWWVPLQASSLWGAAVLLRFVDGSAGYNSNLSLIWSKNFVIEVAKGCSGYEGIGLIWVFLSAHFCWFRKELRFPQVFVLLPLATAAVWGLNLVRLAALVLIGAHVSPTLATGGFHSYLGILLFGSVALLAAAVAHRSAWFARRPVEVVGRINLAAPYLAPFLIVLATALVTGLWARGPIDLFYGVRVVLAGAILWRFRNRYPRGRWDFSLAPVVVGIAIFALWIALNRQPVSIETLEVAHPWRGVWLISRLMGSVLIAPVVEELAFRGYLMRRLTRADFTSIPLSAVSWLAILVSSACFGAMHEHWIAGFIAGIAYAWIARRRGRLFDSVVAHAATNGLLSIYVLATHSWGLWN